jgi:hypothetical protein
MTRVLRLFDWAPKVELLVAMIFLQGCDIISTVLFSITGHSEGSPLLRTPTGSPDWQAILILKFFGICMSAYLLYFAKKLWLFRTLLGLYIAVLAWNLFRAFLELAQ